MSLFRIALYTAAGVGTYEILRRYGLLQKAGQWLNEQVPDDYKDQARQYVDQARKSAEQYGGQLRDKASQYAGQYGDQAREYVDKASNAVRQATGYGSEQQPGATTAGGVTGQNDGGDSEQHGTNSGSYGNGVGQTISGAGRGQQVATDDATGAHVSHTVGRGVVR